MKTDTLLNEQAVTTPFIVFLAERARSIPKGAAVFASWLGISHRTFENKIHRGISLSDEQLVALMARDDVVRAEVEHRVEQLRAARGAR